MSAIPLKLDAEKREELVNRYVAGESATSLAKVYGISKQTTTKYIHAAGVMRPKTSAVPANTFMAFQKAARSIMWRRSGPDHAEYNEWNTKIETLQEAKGWTKQQATVHASKDYPCLGRLFTEHNIALYDPDPESNPNIVHSVPQNPQTTVRCEDKDLTFRENLVWAQGAAGSFFRTGQHPVTCPNDGAYFLYRQAIEDPKTFLQRLGQIEGKNDGDENETKAHRKSIEDLQRMIVAVREHEEIEDEG
jgi:hypothetical protein